MRIPICPSCGSAMYRAKILKSYPKTGPESERLTCALHGPLGQFRHLGSDRTTHSAPPVRTGLAELEAQTRAMERQIADMGGDA